MKNHYYLIIFTLLSAQEVIAETYEECVRENTVSKGKKSAELFCKNKYLVSPADSTKEKTKRSKEKTPKKEPINPCCNICMCDPGIGFISPSD